MTFKVVRRAFEGLLRRIVQAQITRPWTPILVALAVAVVGAALATRLELRTRFEQLLPEGQPSVIELRRVEKQMQASSHVFVVLEAAPGADTQALRALGDAMVPRLRAIGAPWVTDAADGVQEARDFLMPRAGAFAKLDDLQKLHDDLEARWDWEVGNQTGTNLDEDEAPPPITAESIKKRFGDPKEERFPDGYYQSKDGRALVVVANTEIPVGDLERNREAFARIKAVADEVHAQPEHRAVKMGFAGNLVTGLSEYGAVKDDLISVGALGVGLVLAVVLLFFMRVRALVAMGITVAAGLAWTFGLTEIFIGHLNVATGFLVSIVAGNGINFGIIYMARYFEERRRGAAPDRAVQVAHAETWPSTLTAALAAAASYGSLGVTSFRAFKHFAFIGAAGMVVCWIATYAMLPAVLLLAERVRPFIDPSRPPKTGWLARLRVRGIRYDVPFAWVVPRATRSIAIVGVALALVGFVALVPYVKSDPMEYNMRRMQNDLGGGAEMYRVGTLAADILGAKIDSAMVILCDRVDQAPMLKNALEERRDAAPPDAKPFEAVHTLFEFVPRDFAAKLPLLEQIRDRLVRARERGMVSDADWKELSRSLPPPDLKPWTVADLPESLARPFTEKDGTRGRLVLIEPTAGKNDNDLKYLMRWADSFRETTLPNGEVVHGSGRAVIFADIIKAVTDDIPPSIALSLGMTMIAVLVTFRRGASSAAVLGALFVGLGWVALAMAATRLKINFFNFVALPITFGIGVDYAVNFVQRYDIEPGHGILGVLRNTGGAVILCSLTTMLGYLALLRSINQAIRGLGTLAVLGEIGCLLAAVLVLPAWLLWREQRARAHARANGAADAASETSRQTA